MPLQNRVDPWGRLHAVPSRAATLMGNRGILHDAERRVVRRWATPAWIACDLHYGGIRRAPVFKPGTYSELFFLDEATAFAAGHRPCAYCRRASYAAFKDLWFAAVERDPAVRRSHREIDRRLHAERVGRGIPKRTYFAALRTLPDGAMFARDGEAYLVYRARLWRWSFDGYAPAPALQLDRIVEVLTPRSSVAVLAAGYAPQVHPTVGGAA